MLKTFEYLAAMALVRVDESDYFCIARVSPVGAKQPAR
jgi:hypothetical protein